jgi:hypothetical protein
LMTWPEEGLCTAEFSCIRNQGGACGAAGPASAAGSALGGPPAARRAALRTYADQDGSNHTDHAPGEAVVPGFRSSSRAGTVPMPASCPSLPSATPGH